MLGNRYSQHNFAETPNVSHPRSQFDRSFAVKDTFQFDELTPIFVDEVIPGDTFNVRLNAFARLATQAVPIMDNMYIDYFFFFVPNRLVFDNWEKLNGAQDNPGDSTDYILPQMTFPAGGPEVGTLADKFGLPTDVAAGYTIKNSLPFRAYNLIWNEWFRDQNLQNRITVDKDNGPDTYTDYVIKKRNKRHDYFTSGLPWPQKGPAVDLPLGTSALVTLDTSVTNKYGRMVKMDGTSQNTSEPVYKHNTANDNQVYGLTSTTAYKYDPNTTLIADLTTASAATINQLREAFLMQELFELDARGGTRYVEILKSHFGVTSPDYRLQRPEVLGLGSSRINVHPVANQSGTGTQADLAAFATSATSGDIGFSKAFDEHGYVIGLACPRADITYQQGLNKMWSRSTRYDFYWPQLAGLGEQAVLNSEIYLTGNTTTDDAAFAYQERYAEYRYKPSEIHGKLRSTYATPLDMWHLAEEFASAPALNSTFITQTTPIERAIAVPTEPHIIFDSFFDFKCARPMPTHGNPASLGRF